MNDNYSFVLEMLECDLEERKEIFKRMKNESITMSHTYEAYEEGFIKGLGWAVKVIKLNNQNGNKKNSQ